MSVQLNMSTVSRYPFEQQAKQSASSSDINSTGFIEGRVFPNRNSASAQRLQQDSSSDVSIEFKNSKECKLWLSQHIDQSPLLKNLLERDTEGKAFAIQHNLKDIKELVEAVSEGKKPMVVLG